MRNLNVRTPTSTYHEWMLLLYKIHQKLILFEFTMKLLLYIQIVCFLPLDKGKIIIVVSYLTFS